MANVTINSLPTASTIDGSLDILPIYTASSSATQGINRNTLLNLNSAPVGLTDTQVLTNKTLTAPVLNGTISGTYTLGGTPTFPSSVVTLTGSQVLTNKTINDASNTLSVSETSLNFSNVTTGNATSSQHGLLPKLSNTATTYLDGTGNFSTPSAQWYNLSQSLTYSANNGNKEFVLNTSADTTATLQAGMKLAVTRNVAPPTQSMSFTSSSSQYATLATPSGLSFTSAFTCEAWVYLSSYTAAASVSRYNGTNGFVLKSISTGQLQLVASSTTYQTSYQSLPLNQWVHVAGSFSSGTMVLYVNGTVIPSYLTGSGTSITQAGALQIGADNTTDYFNGQISEVRVWSVARSQAQIQANMAISLTGSETNLVGLWQGNGNFNDKTSNANNLTAVSGAIATQASNPYNSIEYGVITKVTNTAITVYTGNSNTIPNMTLNTPQYSYARAPYGFNADKGNWTIYTIMKQQYTQTSPTSSTWYNIGQIRISVPTGAWNLGYYSMALAVSGSGNTIIDLTLSQSSSSMSDYNLSTEAYFGIAGTYGTNVNISKFYNLTSQTLFYLLFMATGTIGTLFTGDHYQPTLVAECAYI